MKNHRVRNDHGAAAVEAALALPFFFLVAFAIFDFASVLYQQAVLTDNLQRVARQVSVEDTIPLETDAAWDSWKTAKVQAPFYASLPSGMVGKVRTLETQTGVIEDGSGNQLGCGIKITLEASITCLSCMVVRPALASDGSGNDAFTFKFSTMLPAEGQISCPATPL